MLSNGERIACDAVLMCGGWTPSVHLYSQSRATAAIRRATRTRSCRVNGRRIFARLVPATARSDLAACLEEGHAAGEGSGFRPASTTRVAVYSRARGQTSTSRKAFVDFQNDVTAKDLRAAAREGFRSIEHVKRYTTTGMATDQGKTSNMNALAHRFARC